MAFTSNIAFVRIEIWLDESDPPLGIARAEGQEPRKFAGWLGLLTALSQLLNRPTQRR